jgi:glycerate 2-kinase
LISGGGSALFETPEEGSPSETWRGELIKRGADIVELNAVRKMLLRVKGGRLFGLVAMDGFACDERLCGDRLDAIASGSTAPTKPLGATL